MEKIRIFINNVDRTNDIDWKTFKYNDEIDDTPNMCEFEITAHDNTFKPKISDKVSVYINDEIFFDGEVVKADNKGDVFIETIKISAKDDTLLLDKLLITARYKNKTIHEIIDALVSDSRLEETITTNNVDCDLFVKTITFNAISISKCIQKLAQQVNFNWYIDENKDIHFFAKNTVPAPYDLTDNNGNFIQDSLTINEDLTQLKNDVIVRGGEKISENAKMIVIKGDGATTTWTTGYKFSETPTITVNGTEISVGVEYISNEDDFDCFWSYSEAKVRFKTAPLQNDIIHVEGTPLIPIMVEYKNYGSIDKYGLFQYKIENKSIRSDEEAQQLADAHIQAYGTPIVSIDFKTYRSGLKSGQTIDINTRGINNGFLIQKIAMTILSTKEVNGSAYIEPIYQVKTATTKTLSLVYFLQKLLLRESDNLEIDENVLIDIINQDQADFGIIENITRENWAPRWCLGEYVPDILANDKKRQSRCIHRADLNKDIFYIKII